jgi:aspartyl/asparaginyl-tRNA synthetase
VSPESCTMPAAKLQSSAAQADSATAFPPETLHSPEPCYFSAPDRRESLPLAQRLGVHNAVVHRVRKLLQKAGYVEVPVPELTAATGSCEVVDSMFSLDYFGGLAFPRQTGQLYLEELVAEGIAAVYCEGESLRKEWKVDRRHLTEFKLIEIEKREMTLDELCDLQEMLVKDVAMHLHADLIGGDNVNRLDRMLHVDHPRLTYREALGVLNRRGFALAFGDDLDRKAEASLNRYCGGLPVHVTRYPESLKFFNMKIDRADPAVVECVDYILPFSGESFGGSVREPDQEILRHRLESGTMYGHLMNRAREFARIRHLARAGKPGEPTQNELETSYVQGIRDAFEDYLSLFKDGWVERAGFGLGVARLLQFYLGMDSIKDCVVFPMDRTCFGGGKAAASIEA